MLVVNLYFCYLSKVTLTMINGNFTFTVMILKIKCELFKFNVVAISFVNEDQH